MTTKPIDIDARALAARGYHALIESIANAQAQLVQIELLRKTFGDKALPPSSIYRSHKNTLGDAPARMKLYEDSLRESLAKNYAQVEALETIFAAEQEEWFDAMREHLRAGRS